MKGRAVRPAERRCTAASPSRKKGSKSTINSASGRLLSPPMPLSQIAAAAPGRKPNHKGRRVSRQRGVSAKAMPRRVSAVCAPMPQMISAATIQPAMAGAMISANCSTGMPASAMPMRARPCLTEPISAPSKPPGLSASSTATSRITSAGQMPVSANGAEASSRPPRSPVATMSSAGSAKPSR